MPGSALVPAGEIVDGEIVGEVTSRVTAEVREPLGLDNVQVHLVDSFAVASDLFRWLGERHPDGIGIDTETTGLSRERDRVRLVQFGDARTGWAVPLDGWRAFVAEVIARWRGTWNTHNGPYDLGMLRAEGIDLPTSQIDDTRNMAHVLSPVGSLALKKLSVQHVDPRAAIGQQLLDEAIGKHGGWTWATVPIDYEPYWFYAGLDPVITTQLKSVLKPRVLAEAPESYALELAVQWITERMERRGVRVDRPYCQQMYDDLTRYVADAEAWCRSAYDVYPGSTSKVIEVLQRDGVVLTKRTRGGDLSLDKEVLQEVIAATGHPLAQVVLGRRQAQKIASTNMGAYLELSAFDGLVHASINTIGGYAKSQFESGGQGGVRTGRMSMSDPNLQNVPTRTKEGRKIRDAFVAREGHVWIKSDFSQIEMRLMALLSNPFHPGLREAFAAPGDFFVNMAKQIFDDPTFVKSDPRRQYVKNGGYAKLYGAGIDKFKDTAGISFDQAAHFMASFDRAYPGVNKFQRDVERQARETLRDEGEAYVRSPLTNRKFVGDERSLYKLVNYLIQGVAAEVMKRKIVEADAAGLGPYMLFPVHDEIDLDVPRDVADDVRATLRTVMNDDQIIAPIPLTSAISVGERWGSLVEEEEWLPIRAT